jgi:transposase
VRQQRPVLLFSKNSTANRGCDGRLPMSHVDAALTPRHRLIVARLVVDDGWPISEVAARFQVSWPTVKRWVDRYLAGESMLDRSSRPKSSPNRTSRSTMKRCVSLRIRLREGPVQLAARLGIAPSTVHRILTSAGLNRLCTSTVRPVNRSAATSIQTQDRSST